MWNTKFNAKFKCQKCFNKWSTLFLNLKIYYDLLYKRTEIYIAFIAKYYP
jgi:hypothetical protein